MLVQLAKKVIIEIDLQSDIKVLLGVAVQLGRLGGMIDVDIGVLFIASLTFCLALAANVVRDLTIAKNCANTGALSVLLLLQPDGTSIRQELIEFKSRIQI